MPLAENERAETLAEMERGYTALTGVLDSLSPSDLERPDTVGHWSGKDVLAHIASWEVEATRYITARDANIDEPFVAEEQFDAFNEDNAAKTRDWTLDQVRAFYESAHRDFVETCRTSTTITSRFALGLTNHHYEEHIDQFRGMKSAD